MVDPMVDLGVVMGTAEGDAKKAANDMGGPLTSNDAGRVGVPGVTVVSAVGRVTSNRALSCEFPRADKGGLDTNTAAAARLADRSMWSGGNVQFPRAGGTAVRSVTVGVSSIGSGRQYAAR